MKKFFVFVALTLGLAGFAFGQENENSKNEADTTVSETPDSVWAVIEFDKQVHNFGTIPFDGDGYCEFTFTNRGTGILVLNNVQSTCGCTVPEWPHNPIQPGESAKIKVIYNTKRSGIFEKGITVYSNATVQTIRLLIKGEVAPQTDKAVLGE